MSEINVLKVSLSDYFTKDILKLILYPLIGSAVVLYILFFTVAGISLDSLEETQIQIQKHEMQIENGVVHESSSEESYSGSGVLDYILKLTVTSWIVGILVYTLGIFIIGYMSIFISLVIIGFLTPKILGTIHRRHYSELEIESNFNIFDMTMKIVSTFLIMIFLLVVLIPFYFIPVINIVAINLPFYYFFHKILHYDIASTITTKEQFVRVYYNDKTSMRLRTLGFYLISLIPFAAFFLTIFYIVYLGHVYFQSLNNIGSLKEESQI